MKVLAKRGIAVFIDCFIIACIVLIPQPLFNSLSADLKSEFLLLLIIPLYCLKDCVFKNASIGKKIVGIEIFDSNWKAPKISALIYRNIWMAYKGYFLFWKSKVAHESKITLFDEERNDLGTVVIDKKVYKRLKKECEVQKGDYCENMTRMYNEYLRGIYIK